MSQESRRERMMPHVATYRRELPVSIERLYENAIDWEHLPYLPRSSFAHIECAEAGVWGFRTRIWPQPYNEDEAWRSNCGLTGNCGDGLPVLLMARERGLKCGLMPSHWRSAKLSLSWTSSYRESMKPGG